MKIEFKNISITKSDKQYEIKKDGVLIASTIELEDALKFIGLDEEEFGSELYDTSFRAWLKGRDKEYENLN